MTVQERLERRRERERWYRQFTAEERRLLQRLWPKKAQSASTYKGR